MSQAEADEEIPTLDVSDDLLERAESVEQMPSLGYIALTAIITASGRSSIWQPGSLAIFAAIRRASVIFWLTIAVETCPTT